MINSAASSTITLSEVRRVLGITATDMPDDAVKLLIKQVDILTDIVVAHTSGSTIKSYIANLDDEAHNDK